ncbi:MAG: galactose mutarotase [Paludibacter sp.]|nr:galactose mutarotase [Paludibacter sp.]
MNTTIRIVRIFTFVFLTLCIFSCNNQEPELLDTDQFEMVLDSKNVSLYTIKSGSGLIMQVTNFGGRVVSLWTPDKSGHYSDIVLGHKNIQEYLNYNTGERFVGCVVGRYANRIANGQFTLDSITYNVPKNNNGQSLHGGTRGLDMVVWNVDEVTENEIRMSYTSADGEEGYPGILKIAMTYTLTKSNEFKITYRAIADKPTVVNLSHHGFFNLKGEGEGTINDHILTINADFITPVDEVLIPTGELMPVEGSPFDFTKATTIGERLNVNNEQLKFGKGYDHNWVLNKKNRDSVEFAASVYEPTSGRYMEVWTDQPGIQFYGGNFFAGQGEGKYGATFNYREALALETQKFPDSPNQPAFPSTRLDPDDEYRHTCIYRFSIR